MFSFLYKIRVVLAISGLLVFSLARFLSSGMEGKPLNAFDRQLVNVSALIRRGVLWGLQGVQGGIRRYVDLRTARFDAERCASDLAKSLAGAEDLRELQEENARLRRLLSLSEVHGGAGKAARVIGYSLSGATLSLHLDEGTRAGIEVGSAVLAAEGVVGQVISTTGSGSEVLLLQDPTSRLGAIAQRSRLRGTLVGAGPNEPFRLEHVGVNAELALGDVLVSSGFDGVIPKGLVLGQVASVDRGGNGMFLRARVSPAVDLARLEEVWVLPRLARGERGAAP